MSALFASAEAAVMVPKSSASSILPSPPSVASILTLSVMATALAGCNHEKIAELFGTIAIAILLILLVQVIVWAGLFAVFVVNLIRLGRGKPSLSWGMTSLCAGAFSLFAEVKSVMASLSLTTLAPLLFSLGLCWVGYKNVKGARERALWERMGERDE